MDTQNTPTAGSNGPHLSSGCSLDSITLAARGGEITGLDIFQKTEENITATRVGELMRSMNADEPTGGEDLKYGPNDAHQLRYWRTESPQAPIVLFVHGGSWTVGTHLDSTGSAKVEYLVNKGYAFATVNYTLIPVVTVEQQIQEVADSIAFLIKNATRLGFDAERIILMGHSSGAHVATLLGTDTSYLDRAGVSISSVQAVIALDGSNYNAMAEILDSPGPVADNAIRGLGRNPKQLQAMSPTCHAHSPNGKAFLLLHVQRQGDIRQAVELSMALHASGTVADLHVFEGEGFEGHMQMLLRLGDPNYPATLIMENWLQLHVPVHDTVS